MPEIAGAHVPPDVVSRIVEHGQTSPHQRLLAAALDEFHAVATAVFVDGALGRPAPAMAIRLAGLDARLGVTLLETTGAISLVVLDDLNGLQLATLTELAGPNLDVRYRDGELVVYCPSLEP